ncbi:MAG: HEAT repeat domain-containing protein [Bryobacterales bacterium]|nr:HEAT repeat domain-containing protein [Bryobacterales bacterium]
MELFLAEPDVVDPVDLAFDENGRLYVAEMRDYPEDPPPGKPARSRIKLLEDADGDGRFERRFIFVDRVLQVSGILPWNGGLIVTSAPDILFFKDTNRDGRADFRQVLYTGFPKVNPEGRITNPRLGVDNWVYCANNGAPGRIVAPGRPEIPPVLVGGADFRFHPRTGRAEAVSGPAQFGLTMDDFGNRFITHNTIHLRHVVLESRYLARAPFLTLPPVAPDISDHGRPSAPMFPLTPPQAWRVERTRMRQRRYQELGLDRVEHASGYFTAAAGSTLYTGDAWPPQYQGSVFTGDVSGNLVHRDILRPDGVTFAAARAKPGVEFLASTDTWFRPCNFANAPDGNLYVADMYRLFIETPESIPEELKKNMNFWAGDNRGRIWRILANRPRRRGNLRPNLGAATSAELVRHLENSNGWHRETAQRLLVERQDRSAAGLLAALARTSLKPEARVRALWTLEGIGALDAALVRQALADPHPGVRENAIRLAEPLAGKDPALENALLRMTTDPAPRVRLQLALTLGEVKTSRALEALADLAVKDAKDPWIRTAVLTSAAHSAPQFSRFLAQRGVAWQTPEFLAGLGALIGASRQPGEIARWIHAAGSLAHPEHALRGLAQGLEASGTGLLEAPAAANALRRLAVQGPPAARQAAWEAARFFQLGQLVAPARQLALARKESAALRAAAVRALRGAPYSSAAPVLARVLSSFEPAEIQVAAVDALAAFDEPSAAQTLLAHWKALAPAARTRLIESFLHRRPRVPMLLEALEKRYIEVGAVDAAARARLLDDPDPANAERARRLFQYDASRRRRVVELHVDVLKLRGDPKRGRILFDEHCGRCHMHQGRGARVGPDLSGVSNKTKEELLNSILDPSYAIEARYVNYIVTTKDGRIYDGILVRETEAAITLRSGSGEFDHTVPRDQIAEMRASAISLMPDDFETYLSRQDLADIIAFLRP